MFLIHFKEKIPRNSPYFSFILRKKSPKNQHIFLFILTKHKRYEEQVYWRHLTSARHTQAAGQDNRTV